MGQPKGSVLVCNAEKSEVQISQSTDIVHAPFSKLSDSRGGHRSAIEKGRLKSSDKKF